MLDLNESSGNWEWLGSRQAIADALVDWLRNMRLRLMHGFVAVLLVGVPGVGAQPSGLVVPVDTAGLANGPYSRMSMLLEKTLFKVDVLTLEVRFGRSSAAALEAAASNQGNRDATYDAVAGAALGATDVWARIRFERDLSFKQFLDAASDNLRGALEAGLIDRQGFSAVSNGLPVWYAFLKDRRVRAGDEMHYRIRGDTLRTVYLGFDGEVLLDQTDIGPERRLSVLGGYFAPGSEFRRPLIHSFLFGRSGRQPARNAEP